MWNFYSVQILFRMQLKRANDSIALATFRSFRIGGNYFLFCYWIDWSIAIMACSLFGFGVCMRISKQKLKKSMHIPKMQCIFPKCCNFQRVFANQWRIFGVYQVLASSICAVYVLVRFCVRRPVLIRSSLVWIEAIFFQLFQPLRKVCSKRGDGCPHLCFWISECQIYADLKLYSPSKLWKMGEFQRRMSSVFYFFSSFAFFHFIFLR